MIVARDPNRYVEFIKVFSLIIVFPQTGKDLVLGFLNHVRLRGKAHCDRNDVTARTEDPCQRG